MSVLVRAAEGTGFSTADIRMIASTAPRRYRKFTINKRSSGKPRIVAQPAKELKRLQRWIVGEELSDLPVSDAAYAYVTGRNIRMNAEVHVKNNFLLKMDLEKFFPSIRPVDLVRHLEKHRTNVYSADDIELLTALLFWRPDSTENLQLCIGAPSSPLISNSLMSEFDALLIDYCSQNAISYSRYADDLTFSTKKPNVLAGVLEYTKNLVSEIDCPGRLKVNATKTIFTSKKHFRQVTGVVLASTGHISLGRERKRTISAMVHRYSVGEYEADGLNYLKGLLAFAFDIEPQFIERLQLKYGKEVVDSIFQMKTTPPTT